jgi:LysM repeat protein
MKRLIVVVVTVVGLSVAYGGVVVVKRGDTLWDLCGKYLGDHLKWPEIARLNKMKNPHLIYPGDRIEFPDLPKVFKGKVESGEVIKVFGDVKIGRRKARAGQKITSCIKVVTGSNSRAELLFAEGDLLQIMPETVLSLEGREEEWFLVKVIKGRVFFAKTEKGVKVITEKGVLKLKGQAMVEYKDGVMKSSVFEGEGSIEDVRISAGFGNRVNIYGTSTKPTQLLAPPTLISLKKRARTGNMKPELAWTSISGASKYIVEIAKEPSFVEVVFDGISFKETVSSDALKEGKYWWRVAGIDKEGLYGYFSEMGEFTIERRIGIRWENRPFYPYKPTRSYRKGDSIYISVDSLIYLLPEEEDNSIAKVKLQIDGGAVGLYREPIRLSEGKHTIVYQAIDMVGEEGPQHRIRVVADGTPPTGELLTSYPIEDRFLTQSATFTITGKDSISGLCRVQVMINDEVFEYLKKAVFALTVEGNYRIVWRLEDNVGNLSEEQVLAFSLDKTGPKLSLATSPEVATYNRNRFLPENSEIILSASDWPAGVATILYKIDNSKLCEYMGPISVKEEGFHIIRYKAIDRAGNETPLFSFPVWIEPLLYKKYKE